jgi:EAL domain-containing protein (putative c-di-GMP-specific phosphodiesterase class I)
VAEHPEDLLRDADIAMYRAKERGKARYEIFDAQMSTQALARLNLESELRRAHERHELKVYYQPIVDVSTERIIGLEALVRWEHPEHGLIEPADFIPLAEETGLICAIDRCVLEESCRQMGLWRQRYPSLQPLLLSANLSVCDLESGTLAAQIAQILAETDFDPHAVQLEITESVMMADTPALHTSLAQLGALGIRLALDDFGKGYSSLSYLERFPVATLKIDKRFLRELEQSPGKRAIIQAVSTLGQQLGIQVVVEGVETVEQSRQVRELGCLLAQGYFFGRPLSGVATELVLAREEGKRLLWQTVSA